MNVLLRQRVGTIAIVLVLSGSAVATGVRAEGAEENVAAGNTAVETVLSSSFDVHAVDRSKDEYSFMRLGVNADYLTAERHRIVEQIQQFIPPLYEPALPFHAYTLPPGTWRVKIASNVFNNNRDFGTDDFYSFFFSDVKVRNTVITHELSYGFEVPQWGSLGRDLVLNLELPYRRTTIRGTGHPFRINNIVMDMNADVEGLGDLTVTLKKKWLDQANYGFNLASVIGVITPTGHHREQFNAAQAMSMMGMAPMLGPPIDVFSARPGERFVPNDAQPGRGAWGGRFGLMATRQFERSALHAGVVAQVYAKTDEDIVPGDELRFGGSYVFPLFPKKDILSLDFSVFGRAKRAEEFPGTITHPERDPATGGFIMDPVTMMPVMFTTARPNFEHGTVLFFQPSMIFTPTPQTRLIASPAFRILEPDKGPSPKFMISSSMEVTF